MTALLSDLTTDGWTIVARRVRVTDRHDGWAWDLSPREVSVLQIARTHGGILVVQKRLPDGTMTMQAKLARKPGREGERFAVMGLGMFEQ